MAFAPPLRTVAERALYLQGSAPEKAWARLSTVVFQSTVLRTQMSQAFTSTPVFKPPDSWSLLPQFLVHLWEVKPGTAPNS